MITLQIISKVLETHDYSIIQNNSLTEEWFVEYEDEFNAIKEHYEKYGNVMDKATFLSKFPDIELVEVTESDRYLIDELKEEHLFRQSVPIVQKIASLLKEDANVAAEYMINEVKNLQPDFGIGGVDIVHEAKERQEEWRKRKEKPDDFFFTTGFPELDDIIHGWKRKEEFVVIVARTNHAKSWVLEKTATHVWQIGYNVGYISPEMGATSVGYRFDTLYKNFSNTDLTWGKDGIDDKEYENYIKELQDKDNKFIVSTPKDFGNRITVSKLRQFINSYKLDFLAIDGITYLTDERATRGDTKNIALTNISEDLMSLSLEMNVPIIVVVQSNRGGVTDGDDTPDIEHIRDSDGISFNASKIISMKLKDRVLTMEVKKQRDGLVGKKVMYQLDVNVGNFNYIPDGKEVEVKKERKKRKVENKEDVF